MSATFRDVTIRPEEAVVVLMPLEMLRKDTVVGFFPFTSPEGEYTTGRDLACWACGFESSLSIDVCL